MDTFELKVIARIYNGFSEKFGIPRQSGLASERSVIIFEPEYRDANALRGIDGYTHLWLIWGFSGELGEGWSPTVRPPRLGGNRRMGVFATRSPNRPNPLGLSSVRLIKTMESDEGSRLIVSGADILSGSPIYDIKPYLSFTDSHPDAENGFADEVRGHKLRVVYNPECRKMLEGTLEKELTEILENDPRPSYQNDPIRLYGLSYRGCEVSFTVDGEILSVDRIIREYEDNAK